MDTARAGDRKIEYLICGDIEQASMASPAEPPFTSPNAPDIVEVRTWLERMIAAVKFAELITAVLALITRLRDLNTQLTIQLAHSRRARPRSETLARVEQLLLFDLTGAGQKAKPDGASPPEPPPKKSRRGRHPGRALLPAHLPRVPVINPVPPEMRICPQCGAEMTTVGHEVCEILEVKPACLFVLQRKDERVACPHDDTIVSAPTPPQLIERGKLGPVLVVESLCEKYIEQQPIERQSRRWTRTGVDLSPQTLGRSVAAAIDLVAPVADEIRKLTVAASLLATDSTGLPVLDENVPTGIRNGTMWCWVGDTRWVTFFYTPKGDSDGVRDFLGEQLRRTVQCDGTSLTTFLERAGGKRPGCWSHGRRRLVECARSGDTLALEGIRLIRRLFAVERLSALHHETAEQRHERRAKDSAPAVTEIRAWVDKHRPTMAPKTPMGRALGYLHRQWARLILFLEDGRIELTNNRVERELRALVLGRKNWLFATGDLGGERTATILTIVGTCVAQRVNPRAYLHLLVKLLIEGWPMKQLRELLPDRLAQTHSELRLPPPALPPPAATPVLPSLPP
jgi:transposase